MNRQLCSYDMFAVLDRYYRLKDKVGDMYFCNLRCIAIWAVQRATNPNLTDEERSGVFHLMTPDGEELPFAGIIDVTKWVMARALAVSSASPAL